MPVQRILIVILFSWVAYDRNLFRRRESIFSNELYSYSIAPEPEHENERKNQQDRRNVVPDWFPTTNSRLRSKCNYFSTKPRDVRFSNQRKIRRMFNNM